MRRPRKEKIDVAILWLQANEGDPGCVEVAEWLASLVDKSEDDKIARRISKQTGRTVAEVRTRMKQMETR